MKRTLCILFSLLLIAGSFTFSSFADNVTQGTFCYLPTGGEYTYEKFFYSDDYFTKSGKTDDEHLLTMSLCLALSTFEGLGYDHAAQVLEDTGFSDVSAVEMTEKPTRDSLGTVMAHKKIGDSDLIAVAIRGAKYDSEWASNFIIGAEGDSKGQSDGAEKVLGRLKEYVAEYGLTNNKIWIVGYSRAGAIADLAGVFINNNLSMFGTTADDLYIYAFEPPASSVDPEVFDNIRCVINKNDLFPCLYPALWGFHLNGKIITIGEDNQTVTTYIKLTAPEEYGTADLEELLHSSFDWLAGRLSREEYSSVAEGPISDLLDIFFSKSDSDRTKILNFLKDDCLNYIMQDENKGRLVDPVWSIMSHRSDYLYGKIANIITGYLDDLRYTENASALTDEEFEILKNSVFPIIKTFGPVVVDDMNYYDGADYDYYYSTFVEDYYLTEEEFGAKYGASNGDSFGYTAGLESAEYDDEVVIYDDYGPEYEAAYSAAYVAAYASAYQLGSDHASDLALRGEYDGGKRGYDTGFWNAKDGDERVPYDEYFYEEDWMTEEYIAAYNKAYEEEYNRGYDEGLLDTSETPVYPDLLDSYHILSIAKNISSIIKNHYPQTSLALITAMDSYYTDVVPLDTEPKPRPETPDAPAGNETDDTPAPTDADDAATPTDTNDTATPTDTNNTPVPARTNTSTANKAVRSPSTGDDLPYMVVLAVVSLIGVCVFFVKERRSYFKK